MPRTRPKKQSLRATLASVKREMAKPHMARSARIAELNLDPDRIPERPSVTMPGIVNRIIPSPSARRPEKAQISVDGADRLYRDLRIENSLLDEHGDDVKLMKGARVEVTVSSRARVLSVRGEVVNDPATRVKKAAKP
jgi:uncharacterized protein YfaS (alpha-2-macroglobulin family)